MAGGELAPRLPRRVEEAERALGQAGALSGVVMADDERELAQGPPLLVAVAIEPVEGRGLAEEPRRLRRVAAGHLDSRPDAQEPGPLEAVAGAALESSSGVAQHGLGGIELVREPQCVGQAPQGACLEVVC